jgi:hypothetical protein
MCREGGQGDQSLETYSGAFVLEADAKLLHRVDRHPQSIEDIVEDDDTPFLLLVFGEAIFGVD